MNQTGTVYFIGFKKHVELSLALKPDVALQVTASRSEAETSGYVVTRPIIIGSI